MNQEPNPRIQYGGRKHKLNSLNMELRTALSKMHRASPEKRARLLEEIAALKKDIEYQKEEITRFVLGMEED